MNASIVKLVSNIRQNRSRSNRFTRFSRVFGLLSIILVLVTSLMNLSAARAATSTVINLNDSGSGSLRQAIFDAAPGDIITFGVTGTITLTSGELAINKNLSIVGSGPGNTIISGNLLVPVLERVVNNSANLTLSNLTIRSGTALSGGGILNSGDLTINDSVITDNRARGEGGGIFNSGTLHINNTTLSSNLTELFNATDASGAGIYNTGTATISNSTFFNNLVHDNGSALFNAGTATITNTTFSFNQENGIAAIYNEKNSTLNLNNITLTLSVSSKKTPGLFANGGTVTVANSIIAGNTTQGNNALPDCSGNITSAGHNLIGLATGCNISAGTGDLLGTTNAPVDAKLGPLQNNGGSTSTHALLTGSPAIDKGSPAVVGSGSGACEATDQRGVSRPVQGAISLTCDIGAFELGGTAPKTTPIITWANPADITFGAALSATQLNATASVPGSFVYTPAAGTVLNAGAGQTLSVDFTPTDTVHFNSVLGTKVLINVNKATPTVTWANPADITAGTPLSATQLNATASVPGTFVYTPAAGTVLSAGAGQTLSVDFTPTDSVNFNSVLGTKVTINVNNKATPIITWANPANITFGAALSATQLNATASVPGTFVYTPATGTVLSAGAGQTLSVDFTPTDTVHFNSVLGTKVLINVNKATPIVTWANPADITAGTALSATQLNATASVPGAFVYTPAAGTVLGAGAGQTLSVDFTPTDSTNYNSVLGTKVLINVVIIKVNPVVTWANPANITFGTALSATQLNATASVPGAFVYTPAAGTILNAGASQTLSVDFTPTDTVHFNSVLGTKVLINVNKATPVVTWANPADITFGTALSATQLNATASVPGTFVYTPAAGTVLSAGAGQTLSVDFTPTNAANYNSVLGTKVTINVKKATPVVTWANPADITFGTALSATQLNATASVPGAFVYTPPSGTFLNVGAGQILSVNFTPTDSANYNSVLGTKVPINVINPASTNTPGKVTGGGVIKLHRGKGITFGFEVKYSNGALTPWGNLTFRDHGANISLKATSFTFLNISGKHAIITGFATVNGKPNVAFILDVYDFGKHGSSDKFMIQIPSLNGYSAGGTLKEGNIQIVTKSPKHDDDDKHNDNERHRGGDD